jgi:glycosyltransferase involved in cell wall biosynthesis
LENRGIEIREMNILHVLDTCNRGGAETLVLDVLRNSNTDGIKMHFASFKGGALLNEYREACSEVYLLNRSLPVDFKAVKRLHNLIVEKDIDIIHTHLTVDILYAQLAKIATKARHVHTHHGYDIGMPFKDSLVERLFSPFLDAQVFVSQPLCDYYRSKYHIHKNWKVIENGVDVRKISSILKSGPSIREELNIDPHVPLIGMVGNFVNSGRDQLTVCKALKIIHDYGDVFQFLFVGRKSSQFPEIYDQCVRFCNENSLSQRVHFLGGREDVPSILCELDLFVYASNHDTFGIAVIEAMLAGIPVIVNDLEIFEIIGQRSKYLSMYPTKDFQKAADMIHAFLCGMQDYALIASRAKDYVAKRYSIENNISSLQSMYKDLNERN